VVALCRAPDCGSCEQGQGRTYWPQRSLSANLSAAPSKSSKAVIKDGTRREQSLVVPKRNHTSSSFRIKRTLFQVSCCLVKPCLILSWRVSRQDRQGYTMWTTSNGYSACLLRIVATVLPKTHQPRLMSTTSPCNWIGMTFAMTFAKAPRPQIWSSQPGNDSQNKSSSRTGWNSCRYYPHRRPRSF